MSRDRVNARRATACNRGAARSVLSPPHPLAPALSHSRTLALSHSRTHPLAPMSISQLIHTPIGPNGDHIGPVETNRMRAPLRCKSRGGDRTE